VYVLLHAWIYGVHILTDLVTCPICWGINDAKCSELPTSISGRKFDCERCGVFLISNTVLDDENDFLGGALSEVGRVCLSQKLQQSQSQKEPPFIKSDWLNEIRKSFRLSSPLHQAEMLIEYIGDYVAENGHALSELPQSAYGKIGFISRSTFVKLFDELFTSGMITGELFTDTMGDKVEHPIDLSLTLLGWAKYESTKSGLSPGKYGFLAMKFGDSILDGFVKNHLKPYIKEKLGFEVIDLRDVPKAGIIDNLMREQIRDSAFVIADLTHDNSGAYWEAGYAEGLGKPVVYICENSKFEEKTTHFDTNHCTTVMWSVENPTDFQHKLVATLRRSLNLFPT